MNLQEKQTMICSGSFVRLSSYRGHIITLLSSLDPARGALISFWIPKLAIVIERRNTEYKAIISPRPIVWLKVMTVDGEVGWLFEHEVELL